MNISTVIVDNERPARELLRYLLEQIDGVKVVGEADNGSSVLKKIREARPQLVFLDIKLPDMTELELALDLNELPHKPLLVVATGYEKYALPAFAVDAIDFLLKPFTQERVAKTCAKAAKALVLIPKSPIGTSTIPTAPDLIFFICLEDGEVFAYTVNGRHEIRSTLDILEQKLANSGFFRTHRNFLVNLNHVCEVIPLVNHSLGLIMDDSECSKVPVSRSNVPVLKRLLGVTHTV